MQRRLVAAAVGTALVSVVLAGAGVGVLTQLSARSQARTELSTQLDALAELLAAGVSPGQLDQARSALDLDRLDLVVIDEHGAAEQVVFPPSRRSASPPGSGTNLVPLLSGAGTTPEEVPSGPVAVLGPDELDVLIEGRTIIVGSDGTTVHGLRRLGVGDPGGPVTVALLATRTVAAIGAEARLGLAVTAMSVLAASLVAAWLMARQLTKPIEAIRRATTSIAAGDFEVRVSEGGTAELAELGRAVNRMARQLERSRQLDQQFLMSVSHDLRTPLTAITGYAEALSDEVVFDTVRTGDVIRNHAHRLERLVGDLLDLARLDANQFQLRLRTLDLNVVVGRTVAGLAQQAKRHDVTIRFESAGPLLVRADPERLAQVVRHIIGDAIRFGRSEIMASVRADGAHAYVEVCDDGPGIAPRELSHLSEHLFASRLQPVRAESPVGLAIVRELTLAMGGTVAAGYRPGGGARITLRLPLVR